VAKTLYLIDGHSQIYRAYYAPFRNLSSPTGEPTRATYVFCQVLLNLIRDCKPDYLAMVLDADESKLKRRSIFPEYKANRNPPPEDLAPQERRIISIIQTARVPLLRQEGFEADDIIATLTRRWASADVKVCIVSRDKDLDQLLGSHVTLFDPMRDEVISAERLRELKGWGPEQAIDAQVLIGDTSDNVPGVPGIGPKTAARLLQQYGSVAGVLEHVAELPPRQREGLLAAVPRLELVRQLVTLHGDVPVQLDLEQAACTRFDWAAVRPVFEELGFRRLAEQLPGQPVKAADTRTVARNTQLLFGAQPAGGQAIRAPTLPQPLPGKEGSLESEAARLAVSLREPRRGQYRLVNTPEVFERLIAELTPQPEFALDTETTSLGPIDCDLVGLSLAWEVGRAWYLPVRNVFAQALPLETVRAGLGPLLADPTKRKVGHHLKYDLNVLRGVGLPVAGSLWDTMIAAFVVDPSRGSYSLDALVLTAFAHVKIPTTDLIGKGRDQLRMDQVPLERIAEYACEDADYTWRLRQLLEPQLGPLGLGRLFYDLEMPLVAVLTDMENDGVALDTELLREIGRQMAARVGAIEEQVHRLAGMSFNLDSPKQLAEVVFERLGCRVVRRTKTARSTDADTLEALRKETQHPIFPLLLEYREIQKLRGTYVDALPAQLSRRTGRIHTSYHQTGAVTGRLSSSEPNLQNIPIRTELGRQIRRAFVPRSKDELLVVADYSQIELRVLAHFCEDPALMQAFSEDQDIHAFVAAQVNNVPLPDVTKEMRSRAKAVNFGIIYGQTAFGLAQATGMSRTEAQAFIAGYFARYPRIREFIDRCIADARREGLVRTILGRRRPIENLRSQNPSIRAQAERFAVNTVIQGSAADLIKVAMIQLHRRIRQERLPLRMLLQVHDELVCEAPRSAAPAMAEIMRTVMSGAMKLRVPLKVDVACGENWLDAK
jgi:DNA polymerase-1